MLCHKSSFCQIDIRSSYTVEVSSMAVHCSRFENEPYLGFMFVSYLYVASDGRESLRMHSYYLEYSLTSSYFVIKISMARLSSKIQINSPISPRLTPLKELPGLLLSQPGNLALSAHIGFVYHSWEANK